MEQQLINAMMKLIAKAGGGALIRDMIQQVEQNGNPKIWTPSEITAAADLITWQTENFGSAEARAIIESLQKKYNLQSTPDRREINDRHEDLPEVPGVHGLR